MTQREWRRQHLLWTIHRWMRQYGVWFVLVILFFTASPAPATETKKTAAAQAPEVYRFEYPKKAAIDKAMEPSTKTLTGEVGIAIKMGINVVFDRNAKEGSSSEMWLDFTKGTKVRGVKQFTDFRPGDTVKVTYQESKDASVRAIEEIELVKRLPKQEKERLEKAQAMADRSDEALAASLTSDKRNE